MATKQTRKKEKSGRKGLKTQAAGFGSAAEGFLPPVFNPALLKEFLRLEASGGIILLIFAVLALLVANSPLGHLYHTVLHETNLVVKIGDFGLDKHIIHWINDGLMAIFFLLVGLEIKREMLEGSLSTFKQALLPAIAAAGGMIFPGLIYTIFNMYGADGTIDLTQPQMAGWAIPTATDIAFAVGILSLLGTRVPLPLKVFLLALAIFDDLGAIIIIALFYSQDLHVMNLVYAGFFIGVLILLNRANSTQGSMYLVAGICLWFCVLKSGVHATLAGVLVALTIPLNVKGERRSLLRQLEHDLHPFVAFVVLPLFAFANAGVSFEGIRFDILFEPTTLGIILGLFLGKQMGIFTATWLAHVTRIAQLPPGVTWLQVWGVACVAGVGFTMSIFIASLGFIEHPLLLTEAKLGILVGSLVSALVGMGLLYYAGRAHRKNG